MRIKDEIFCFAHLRWCHDGWASNILIVVDTGYAGIHHSNIGCPSIMTPSKMGKTKNLIFYSLNVFCFLCTSNLLVTIRCKLYKEVVTVYLLTFNVYKTRFTYRRHLSPKHLLVSFCGVHQSYQNFV